MTDWNAFLAAQGARFDGSGVSDFQSTPIPYDFKSTFLVDLSHQGLLAIEGPDAAKFLQGQVTCDVRELINNHTRLGAQCDLKGRILMSFRALQLSPEKILLRMPHDLISLALTTLGKYIVFSKAKLHNGSADYRRIGLVGPRANEILMNYFESQSNERLPAETRLSGTMPTKTALPAGVDQWSDHAGNLFIKLAEDRYECWIISTEAELLWQAFAPGCQLAGSNLWTLLDIRAGIGEVRLETRELFTPQALNFQLTNAVSFRKGCYTGQEIVARLHYRGTLKRHMYRVMFSLDDGENLPLPGTEIINEESKKIGELVLIARLDLCTAEALAVIPGTSIHEAFIAAVPPKKLKQAPLPYAIPSEEIPQ